MAVNGTGGMTLVLRFADVGVATYGSLRVVGDPARTVTWVVADSHLNAATALLDAALPVPYGEESAGDAIDRALTAGPLASPDSELRWSYQLGSLLLSVQAWTLLSECVADPRPMLFVTPTARLAQTPFAMLAVPTALSLANGLVDTTPAEFSGGQELPDLPELTDGYRLMEIADVVMAPPANIVRAPRRVVSWEDRRHNPPVLLLDPRVPGQRPDSPLGSVLGRPSPTSVVAQHFAEILAAETVIPDVGTAVELFRRSDIDRIWMSRTLQDEPSRLLFVGHASAAPGDAGYAERAAIHLACKESIPGYADVVGTHRPFTAADLLVDTSRWPMPPRVALVACASGSDYRFDEATGMVAALILAGAEVVTATLWSLPTTAGYLRFQGEAAAGGRDPMAELIVAVDSAHRADDAARSVGRWQRAQMRRWRDGDVGAHPIYWGALVTFVVGAD
ncbi:CHAT domain-containing protein [Williamsia soli]|uniref:CHAT domain-containing protein n=1 Tax=Williamsia soli TaxID=364929 RepID=UPI001A9D3C03|nr:CHAT domain-containing protein [Williamsia soli]